MEIFYVHDIPYIHVDWETSKASDTESEAMAFLTGEMGMMPINSTIVDNKLLCDIPKKLIVGMYGLKVVWVKKSASGKKSEDILESDIQSISRIHDLFGITSSQYAVTYTGSEITFHVRSNPTPYFYSPIGSWRSVPMSLDGVNYSDDDDVEDYTGDAVSDEEHEDTAEHVTTGSLATRIQNLGVYLSPKTYAVASGGTIIVTFTDSNAIGSIVDVTSGDVMAYTVLANGTGEVTYTNNTASTKDVTVASSAPKKEFVVNYDIQDIQSK